MARLSDEQIAAIKARKAKATPGPWEYQEPTDRQSADPYKREGLLNGPSYLPIYDTASMEPNDAEFIANARTDIPALLADLEEARRERDEAREALRLIIDEAHSSERNSVDSLIEIIDIAGRALGEES